MPGRRDCEIHSITAVASQRLTRWPFDRSDQINQNSRGVSVPPRGAGQTVQKAISLQCRKIRQLSLRRPKSANFVSLSHTTCTLGASGSPGSTKKEWWSLTGSNRRHPACKAGALPAELRPHSLKPNLGMVGPGGLEPPTSRLSGVRSNHLSYGPPDVVWTGLF